MSKTPIVNQVRYILIIFSVFLFSLTVISCKSSDDDDDLKSSTSSASSSTGLFVTVGDNGIILTSSDGISWTKRTSGDQPTTTTIVSVSDSGGDMQIESTNHSLDEGDVIRFTTTDSLPTGLALATDYYVVGTPSTNTFFVSATESGTPIVYTDAGTGTHSWQSSIALLEDFEQYDGRARASFSVTSVTTNILNAVTYSNH